MTDHADSSSQVAHQQHQQQQGMDPHRQQQHQPHQLQPPMMGGPPGGPNGGQGGQGYPGPPPHGGYGQPMFDPYGQYPPGMHGYPMPPMMYAPQMVYHPSVPMGSGGGNSGGGGPPSQQQQHAVDQQPPHPEGGELPKPAQSADKSVSETAEGMAKASIEDNKAPGQMSWAQIARDQSAPDQPAAAGGEGSQPAQGESASSQPQQDQDQQAPSSSQQHQQARSSNSGDQQHRGPRGSTGSGPSGPSRNWSVEVKTSARQFAEAQRVFVWANHYQMNPFAMVCANLDPSYHNMVLTGQQLPPGMEQLDLMCKHLRTICAFGFLAYVNSEEVPASQNGRRYFVVECANEMEVYYAIKRMAWIPDSPETEAKLNNAYAETVGVGALIIFFKIPSLRKLVGVAQVLSPVIKEGAGEHFVQLRWIYIRDIPIHNLKTVNFLNNPDLPNDSRLQHRHSSSVSPATPAATGGEDASAPVDAAPATDEGEPAKNGTAESDAAADKAPTAEDGTAEGEGDAKPEAGSASAAQASPAPDTLKVFAVTPQQGNFAFDTMGRFKFNGGILLDFQEYMFAEQTGKPPRQSMLMCGGPRPRTANGSSRGRGRGMRYSSGGRGRGGQRGQSGPRSSDAASSSGPTSTSSGPRDQSHESKPRGRGRGRGRSSRGLDERRTGGGRGREGASGREGGRGRDRDREREGGSRSGGATARSSTGEDSGRSRVSRKVEGSDGAQTLRSQYQFDIQVKKGKAPKKVGSKPSGEDAAPAPAAEE